MLQSVLRFELGFFLLGLCALVAYRLLTGAINTRGLFFHVDPATRKTQFSPEKVQLAFVTVLFAGYYISLVFNDPSHLPDVPQWLLWTQGGSGGVYLTGKSVRLFAT